jgi:phosphatidylserine decarboxylase
MNSVPSTTASLPLPGEGPSWFRRIPLATWGWREINLWGWPLLLITIVLLLLGAPWCWLAIVPAAMLGLLVYFFRDPKRTIPDGPNLIVSPADGTVTDVTPLPEYEFIGRPAVRVGIFLSVLNVHINRAPSTGRVLDTHYKRGEFVNAQRPDCADRNESNWIGFEDPANPQRRFALRQVSGMLARKIVCTLGPGSTIHRGEKFGMIKLGSRTEVILPADSVMIHVRPGDKVHAGSDIIGRWT